MDLIDDKYINLISSRVDKFAKKNQNLYNCRCPICGDSRKNKSRARGYFYSVKNNTNYKCHNCGINVSLNNFLKTFDPVLHQEYCLEKYSSGFTGKNFTAEAPKFKFQTPKFKTRLNLPKASENERSKRYLEYRKLDASKFYYAEKFKEWTNSLIHTFDEKSLKYEEPRIIIPLYYKKELVGFQGRSLDPSPIKYITIMLDKDSPKLYGYDDVDLEQFVYVLEGPFDSTFIKNSIAMCGSDLNLVDLNISRPVYVYDNEPRNIEIHKRMDSKIQSGDSIVIWPITIKEKDVNEMFLSGHNVQSMIELNTYSGLEAKLKFNEWKKV
jgi:hypothetical protein